MELSGRCYCGDIQYEINGELQASFQCHCRECQYITGGNANTVMVFSEDDFQFTKGKPSVFARKDLETPVKRFFAISVELVLEALVPRGQAHLLLRWVHLIHLKSFLLISQYLLVISKTIITFLNI